MLKLKSAHSLNFLSSRVHMYYIENVQRSTAHKI